VVLEKARQPESACYDRWFSLRQRLSAAETFYQQLTNRFMGSNGFYLFGGKALQGHNAAPPIV
jgi:hypothetical protein